jgi:hypothetical protein
LHPHQKIIYIRPYKINYLLLKPIYPIFDAGGRHFSIIARFTGMMQEVFIFLTGQKCDTPTLEKITHGWTIAYFSAALLVTTSCFLSSAIGDCSETTSRRTLTIGGSSLCQEEQLYMHSVII